jgi:signal transduction histidine kinase
MLSLAARFFLGLFLFMLTQVSASANDQITHRAYYEDKGRELTFSEVMQKRFNDYSGILSLGYLKAAVWIHLNIDPHETAKETSLVLRIRPGFLDKIELFDPIYDSLGEVVTGDEQPTRQQTYESLNHNFVVPVGLGPRDLWLRVTSSSTMFLEVQALPLSEAFKEDRLQELKYAAYLALLLIFVLWGLLSFANHQERTIGTFALTQFLCLIHMAGALGFYRGFWPFSNVLTEGTFVDLSVAPFIASGFRLDYLLLRESAPNPQLLRILKWSPAYLPIYLSLMAFGFRQEAFNMSIAFAFGVTLLYLILALTIPVTQALPESQRPYLSRRSLIALYSLIFGGLSLSALPSMGIMSASFLVFDGYLLYSIFSGCAFLIMLHLRAKESIRRASSLKRDYADAQHRAQYEAERRQEQAQFLSMLTHELRTSLSVVSMVLGAKEQTPALRSAAEKSIREMGEIIERCLNVDKHEANLIEVNLSHCDLQVLTRDLIACCTEPHRVRLIIHAGVASYTDIFWVKLILANLIDNAIKYSPTHSSIDVDIDEECHQQVSFTRISVTNLVGGAGQPAPEKVFQKYYRHPKAHAFTGTGLGLFLSAQLAQRLEAKLEYIPTNTHVKFTLCLPHSILR